MIRILLTLIILLLASPTWAATYYVRADGTAANLAAATGPSSDATKCTNITNLRTYVGAGGGIVADDIIYFSDKGGIFYFPSSYYMMLVRVSGTSGHQITFKNAPGETPVFVATVLDTGWSGPDAGGIYNVATEAQTTNGVYEDGIPIVHGSAADTLTAGQWFWASNVLYYKPSSGVATDHVVRHTNATGSNVFNINAQSYLTFDGLTFRNFFTAIGASNTATAPNGVEIKNCSFYYGVYPDYIDTTGNATTINISNNYYYRTSSGGLLFLHASGTATFSNVTMNYNTLVDVGVFNDAGAKWATALLANPEYCGSGGQNFNNSSISYNTSTGGYHQGWQLYTFTGATSAGNTIKNNVTTNNTWNAITVQAEATGNFNGNVISYNVFNTVGGTANRAVLLAPGGSDSATNYIVNNTFYNCYSDITITSRDAAKWTFANNIHYGTTAYFYYLGYSGSPALVSNYNLYYPVSGSQFYWNSGDRNWTYWTATLSKEANSPASSDPKLTSTTNFHLLPGSPAINAGVDVSLTSDIEGRTVPQGLIPDIGAYEYIQGQHLMTPKSSGRRSPLQ